MLRVSRLYCLRTCGGDRARIILPATLMQRGYAKVASHPKRWTVVSGDTPGTKIRLRLVSCLEVFSVQPLCPLCLCGE